ncbi:hypothetical protein [Arenibacterium halophilum]|uniref:Hemolysin-type calcium-binding repeat-containing protein n=1 Tax=Arenibacterium halophilum TaxID=2583821 RepID=A0ABY2X6V6_9RHOB|nr:hypothetical protein [Arenibacterium halophilum]TMV11504.1 hypothetical protein FGK64_14590 [Arenibacterium halophilum]
MRTRVIGDSEDNNFGTDFDLNETFVGRGGDDSFMISWFEERDRFIGGPGSDTLVMDYFRLGEYGQIPALNRAIWFDGGTGIDRIEYKVIYTPESHSIDLNAFGGTLNSVEQFYYLLTDHQSWGEPVASARFDVTGTSRGEEITLSFGHRMYDHLVTTLSAGGGNDSIEIYGGNYDTLVINGGAGSDRIVVHDVLRDPTESDLIIRGGAGNDKIHYNDPGGKVYGGAGRDMFLMSAQSMHDEGPATVYRGGKGSDTFVLWKANFADQVGATIRGFGARDKLVLTDTYVGSMEAVSLFPTDPPSYVEYNPISGILSLSGSAVVQFTPGTILTPGQVSVVDADVIADYFFL